MKTESVTMNRGGFFKNGSRSPPFVFIGLLIVIGILAFNYWSLTTKNSDLEMKLSELHSAIRDSSEALKEEETNNRRLTAQNEDITRHYTSEIEKLNKYLEEDDQKMVQLQNEMKEKNEGHERELQEKEEKISNLSDQLSMSENKIGGVERNVEEKDTEIENLKAKIKGMKKEMDELRQHKEQTAGQTEFKKPSPARIDFTESNNKVREPGVNIGNYGQRDQSALYKNSNTDQVPANQEATVHKSTNPVQENVADDKDLLVQQDGTTVQEQHDEQNEPWEKQFYRHPEQPLKDTGYDDNFVAGNQVEQQHFEKQQQLPLDPKFHYVHNNEIQQPQQHDQDYAQYNNENNAKEQTGDNTNSGTWNTANEDTNPQLDYNRDNTNVAVRGYG